MKIMKKLINILLIFVILQMCILLIGNSYVLAKQTTGTSGATGASDTGKSDTESSGEGQGFFDTVFSRGKEFDTMGKGDSQKILDNTSKITEATDEVYNAIRVIGIGIFMVNIFATFITLSMKNNGQDIAGAKLTITFSFILAILFINAKLIMDTLEGLFKQLEGTM